MAGAYIEIPGSGNHATLLQMPQKTLLANRGTDGNPPNGQYAIMLHDVVNTRSLSGLLSSKIKAIF